jgi:DNA-binding MarR family transcriptional regulator
VKDEVDSIVAGWRRALPEVDVSPLEVLSRVTRLAKHLDRRRSTVFARHNLETWTFDVLAALRRAGPPFQLSPGELLTATLVTSGTMTNRINLLEARGFVVRKPDSVDARIVRVRLTTLGRHRVDAALKDLVEQENLILAALGTTERGELAGLLRRILVPFDLP